VQRVSDLARAVDEDANVAAGGIATSSQGSSCTSCRRMRIFPASPLLVAGVGLALSQP
jgi:hypothetical protein